MLPYLAQGANSSLEDGAVLGLLLGHMTDKTQLPQILRLYESLRKSRGEAIVRETFKQVSIFNLNLSEVFEAANHHYRDTTSTWKMAKSRRSVTSSSYRNSEKKSRATSPADGEFFSMMHRRYLTSIPLGHALKFSLGCMDTML
jgi:2-polyprenyl-6-methoxyphenol hydroxylase-like FAD-dependent oxidoreductase